jgi:two-component system, NarL family, nitrate/nitrite response regulator NarP
MDGTHKIIVGDSNTLILQALADMIEKDRRFSLVATARTAEGFLETCLRVPVDVGVLEWDIPKLGAAALLDILRDRPSSPRIVVYASSTGQDVTRRAMLAGAAGYCPRDTQEQQLLDIAASVAAGRMVFPFVDLRNIANDPRAILTTRERDMLTALARGRTNAQLADELAISINTVKFHLRNLYDKLELKNRAQAIAFFYEQQSRSG